MAKPFDSEQDLNSRALAALIEALAVPGQASVSVVNPDGSTIGGGGGGGMVDQGAGGVSPWLIKIDQAGTNNRVSALIRDSSGNAITNGQQVMAASVPVVIASNQTAIPVTLSGSVTSLTPSSNQINVAAGPTAVPLAGVSTQVDSVHIIAKITNLNNIFLGPSTVTSATGLILEPGRGVTLENVNLNTVYINGTAGEGVSFFALT